MASKENSKSCKMHFEIILKSMNYQEALFAKKSCNLLRNRSRIAPQQIYFEQTNMKFLTVLSFLKILHKKTFVILHYFRFVVNFPNFSSLFRCVFLQVTLRFCNTLHAKHVSLNSCNSLQNHLFWYFRHHFGVLFESSGAAFLQYTHAIWPFSYFFVSNSVFNEFCNKCSWTFKQVLFFDKIKHFV